MINNKIIYELSDPMCKCYSKLGVISSLLNENFNSKIWFLNNYMNMILTGSEHEWIWLELCGDFNPTLKQEWECIPFIKCESIDADNFNKSEIFDFIYDSLDNKKVVYGNIDVFYLNRSKYNRLHDMLIVGYDPANESFLCKDYLNGYYKSEWINRSGIVSAFMSKQNMKDDDRLPLTYTFTKKDYPYTNYKEIACKNITDYLAGTEFMFRDITAISGIYKAFGINIYDELSDKLDFIIDDNPKLFYAIKDHFIIIKELISILNSEFIHEAVLLQQQVDVMCNVALKGTLTHNKRYIGKLSSYLNDIKKREEVLLKSVISRII